MKQEADKAGGPIAQTTSHDTSTHPACRLPLDSTDKYQSYKYDKNTAWKSTTTDPHG